MTTPTEDFSALLELPRWPRRGDRLLREAADWRRGVEFPEHQMWRHAHIWTGYIRAGGHLIEACGESRYEAGFLIFPILYNYRHGVELAMKWIITRYGAFSSIDAGDIEHHDLWRLWGPCKAIIIELGGEDGAIPVVEQIVKDFHDLDESAQAFRYARGTQGTVIPLPRGMIDLENIQDVMAGVAHFFDGADAQLDANCSAIDWHDDVGC